MKVGIILLSILVGATVWWWSRHRKGRVHHAGNTPPVLKAALRSVAAGVAAYFVLMAVAMLYLMATTA